MDEWLPLPARRVRTEDPRRRRSGAVVGRRRLRLQGHEQGDREVGDDDTKHEWVDHGSEEWVRGDVSTQNIESAWSLLKRSIVGSYHQLSAKHLPAYLDEISFRFNNRANPYLFRDTLIALLTGEALTYEDLTAEGD